MRYLLIEHVGPGRYRAVNGLDPEDIDVHGPTLEETMVTAMVKAGVGTAEQVHALAGSFDWAAALDTLMGGESRGWEQVLA